MRCRWAPGRSGDLGGLQVRLGLVERVLHVARVDLRQQRPLLAVSPWSRGRAGPRPRPSTSPRTTRMGSISPRTRPDVHVAPLASPRCTSAGASAAITGSATSYDLSAPSGQHRGAPRCSAILLPSSRADLRSEVSASGRPARWRRPSRKQADRRSRVRRRCLCSWVTSMSVCPWACSSPKSAMISSPVRMSRLPVGSSASSSAGSVTSARAMATRWRWPPDSSLGRWSMRSPRPTFSSAAAARSRRSRCFMPA